MSLLLHLVGLYLCGRGLRVRCGERKGNGSGQSSTVTTFVRDAWIITAALAEPTACSALERNRHSHNCGPSSRSGGDGATLLLPCGAVPPLSRTQRGSSHCQRMAMAAQMPQCAVISSQDGARTSPSWRASIHRKGFFLWRFIGQCYPFTAHCSVLLAHPCVSRLPVARLYWLAPL